MPTFFLMILFIYGCVGSSLLPGLFSSCGKQGPLSGWGAQASLVAEHGLCAHRLQELQLPGPRAQAQ